jgi:hypothetical protein
MRNIEEIIEEIQLSEMTDKEKKDKLLEHDSKMYCYLGTDSSKKDIEQVRKNSRKIYRAIATLEPSVGRGFLWYLD